MNFTTTGVIGFESRVREKSRNALYAFQNFGLRPFLIVGIYVTSHWNADLEQF